MPTNTATHNRTQQHQRTSPPRTARSNGDRIEQATEPISEWFEQTINSYREALRTGVRLQEESAKLCSTFLEQTASTREWQKTLRTMTDELLPEAQKRMEDGLRLVEQNGRASLDLLKLFSKGVEVPYANPLAGSQDQFLSLWESSLKGIKESAQVVAKANTQAMESWMELCRKGTEMATDRARG